MIALVGAMFVALVPSASAQTPAIGNVSANAGFCVADNDETADNNAVQTASDSDTPSGTAITVVTKLAVVDDPTTDADETAAQENTPVTCSESIEGMRVKVTPNGTAKPLVEALAPEITISTSDSDGSVKPGSSLRIWFTFKNSQQGSATAPNIAALYVQGATSLYSYTAPGTTGRNNYGEAAAVTVPVPAGTPAGEYVISVATLKYDHDTAADTANAQEAQNATPQRDYTNTPTIALSNSKTITVGDAGVNAATATFSLDYEVDDIATSTTNEAKAESGSTSAGGDIFLKVQVFNSLGEKANGSGINTLTVIAPGAVLTVHAPTAAGTPNRTTALTGDHVTGGTNSISVGETAAADDADVVGQTMFVRVRKAGNPPKPGMINVYALVIGSDGAPRTETLTLNFTGAASMVVLGDDVSVGKPAEGAVSLAEISLGAQDSGGNKTAPGTVGYKITDADGDAVSQSMVKAVTSTAGSSTPNKESDNNPNASVVLVTVDDTAKPGVYTIEASIAGVKDSSDTATVTVSGAAASVDLSADKTSSDSIGDVITVTATIADADGHSIADGQLVTFNASGKGLVQIGTDADSDMGGMQSKTKNGQATAKFTVTGEGTSVVSAVIGTQTAVVVITSTAGSTEAMADEEASVACLSNLAGFSTWSCGVETSASEIFGFVSARGATAIHLWNGSAWVRYSVVDGTMVPGSSDFMVAENDILYISN